MREKEFYLKKSLNAKPLPSENNVRSKQVLIEGSEKIES